MPAAARKSEIVTIAGSSLRTPRSSVMTCVPRTTSAGSKPLCVSSRQQERNPLTADSLCIVRVD